MNCIVCHQGTTRPGTTTVTFSRDGWTLVVRAVPADVCENCGETYVDEKTTQRLLDVSRRSHEAGTAVVVRDYTPEAA